MDQRKRIQREIDRKLKKGRRVNDFWRFLRNFGVKPMQYKKIEVPDYDRRSAQLSEFRSAYAEFFSDPGLPENTHVQQMSTQFLWHRLYLQKSRLDRLGVTLSFESKRVKREEDPKESVREEAYSDGRFQVSQINEAIYAKRTFFYRGKDAGTFYDYESLEYSILSAEKQGKEKIVCPGCGNPAKREDLLDGCDYCGTRFTLEDLKDKVGSFGFVLEIATPGASEGHRETYRQFDAYAAEKVRPHDLKFSVKDFCENLYNKLCAIHYADDFDAVSAFSEEKLSNLEGKFAQIVDMDLWGIRMDDYTVENGIQRASCVASMVLFGLVDGKIQLRNEHARLTLEKAADCLTQNVCAPAVLRCKGCGSSLTLLEGKSCPHCGRERDLKAVDWVIVDYDCRMSDYGTSWRTI